MQTHAEIAAILLRDAASFFRNIGNANPPLNEQMQESAAMSDHVAHLMETDPLGSMSPEKVSAAQNIGEQFNASGACIKNTEAAARLLRGAAHFFRTVGEQDESYAEQMNDNADVYEQMAQLVETNPEGTINMDASLNRGEAVGRSQDQNRSENSSPENTKDHFTEARTNISADAVRRLFPRTSHESMPPEDQKEFINLVSPINRKHTIDGNSAIIERTGLPFYKNTYLIEVRDKSWQPGTGPFWFLHTGQMILHLDGASDNIHTANGSGIIQLNPDNAIDYLRFFCFFVHGEAGPFYVLEDLDHPVLDVLQMDRAEIDTIQKKMIQPAASQKNDGSYTAHVSVLYGGNLFNAEFAIHPDGSVEMVDDNAIATDLPVR